MTDHTADAVARARAFTEDAHELAPRLWGMLEGRFKNLDDAQAEFERFPLAVRDAWARIAAWHLRQVLKAQEAAAMAMYQRLAKQVGSRTGPFVCPVEIEVVGTAVHVRIGEVPELPPGSAKRPLGDDLPFDLGAFGPPGPGEGAGR